MIASQLPLGAPAAGAAGLASQRGRFCKLPFLAPLTTPCILTEAKGGFNTPARREPKNNPTFKITEP
jgi:hypothetical protein